MRRVFLLLVVLSTFSFTVGCENSKTTGSGEKAGSVPKAAPAAPAPAPEPK